MAGHRARRRGRVRSVAGHAGVSLRRDGGAATGGRALHPVAVWGAWLAAGRVELPARLPRREGVPRERSGDEPAREWAGVHLRAPAGPAGAPRGERAAAGWLPST